MKYYNNQYSVIEISKKPLDERKLGKLIKKLKTYDILITSEISRINRNLLQIMSVLHHCMNIGCQVPKTKKTSFKDVFLSVVAGAGFEPTTFRL